MIQRVQTLYLLLATALMSLTLFLPLANIWQADNTLVIKAFSVDLSSFEFDLPLPIYLGIILTAATLLPFITIFLFKKRLVQIRLCVSELVLLVGAIAFIALYCYRLCSLLSEVTTNSIFTISFAAVMPIIAIILVILAMRAIAKDEALVRSLDRIR